MDIRVPKGKEIFKNKTSQYTLVGKIKFHLSLEQRLNNDLGVGSEFQKFLDNMILTDMEKYIPKRTGALINSGILNTVLGQGMLTWKTPYARKQYYGGRIAGEQQGGSLRGRSWGDRAKNDKSEQWTKSAREFLLKGM